MLEYVWLFPLLFIFHDMEEIIGYIPWLKHNREFLKEKYPAFLKPYEQVTSEGFAFAVFEELLVCIFFCIISIVTDWYGLWLGGFIGCTLHFLVHIVQSVVIRKYIPAFITSIIALPISLYVIYKSMMLLDYSTYQVIIYSLIGTAVIALNLAFAHRLMRWFSRKNSYLEDWNVKNNVDKKEHLPFIGVGPIIVIPQLAVTAVAITLSEMKMLCSVKIKLLNIPLLILGVALIIFGIWMWYSSNFQAKIDKNIKENHLVTTGVYSIVRNPIYSAFFIVCTGAIFIETNLVLLVLPVIYYIYMTVFVMKTEEKWLSGLYGHEYEIYCKKVNRCIPWFAKEG